MSIKNARGLGKKTFGTVTTGNGGSGKGETGDGGKTGTHQKKESLSPEHSEN